MYNNVRLHFIAKNFLCYIISKLFYYFNYDHHLFIITNVSAITKAICSKPKFEHPRNKACPTVNQLHCDFR